MEDRFCRARVPTLFSALVYLLTTNSESVFAQHMQSTLEQERERLKELLFLTDAQTAKVLKIYGDWQYELSKVLEPGERKPETMRGAIMAVMERAEKQMDLLLTADQKKELISSSVNA